MNLRSLPLYFILGLLFLITFSAFFLEMQSEHSFKSNIPYDDTSLSSCSKESTSIKYKALLTSSKKSNYSGETLLQILISKGRNSSLRTMVLIIVLMTFVTEDLTCIAAGLLASLGIIELHWAILSSLVGIFLGDILLFYLGRFIGKHSINKAPIKWFLNEQQLEASKRWFKKKGSMVILLSRFLPGSRLPTYVFSGMIGTNIFFFRPIFY